MFFKKSLYICIVKQLNNENYEKHNGNSNRIFSRYRSSYHIRPHEYDSRENSSNEHLHHWNSSICVRNRQGIKKKRQKEVVMTLYSEERYVEEIDKDVDFSIHTEKTYIDGFEESECVTDVTWKRTNIRRWKMN